MVLERWLLGEGYNDATDRENFGLLWFANRLMTVQIQHTAAPPPLDHVCQDRALDLKTTICVFSKLPRGRDS